MGDFSAKVVAITGATKTLGKATAIDLYNSGAKLALIVRRRSYLQDSHSAAVPKGDTCLYASGDLTDPQSVAQIMTEILEAHGRPDILVNIAGSFTMDPPVRETPGDDWDFMFNLNARTAFLMCRAAAPHLIGQKYGKIVNIGARAALSGKANMAPYVASESAVIRLTESLAEELWDYENINVNCILPGTIVTRRNRLERPDAEHSRWVKPEELADVILFRSSENARAIDGASIPAYGRS